MYPLKTLLVSCTGDMLSDLRRELATLSVPIEAEFLDVRSCLVNLLANPGELLLVIVHPTSLAEIVQLERLNEAVVGMPILALVDPTADPSIMVRAMRAGAAQVVRLPLQPDDFHAAMHRIAVQFGHPTTNSRLVTVTGAVEGGGVTTIALNLASELGRLSGGKCILGEAAVGFGRLANYLNITPTVTLLDLLSDPDHMDVERVRHALTKVDDHLEVLTGSYRGIVPFEIKPEGLFKLLGYTKELAEIVVVDGRYHFEDLDFDFLDQTQQVVLVAKPTIPSLYALRMLLEKLAQRECLAQLFVVINQYESNTDVFSARRIEAVLPFEKVFTVAADPVSFHAAENAGQTLRRAAPRGRALADIGTLASALLGRPRETQPWSWSFLHPLESIAHSLNLK